tara:strand:+ start:1094 stop:1264 length:171 start_codon:yes stop_codon:yes gene_type:complete
MYPTEYIAPARQMAQHNVDFLRVMTQPIFSPDFMGIAALVTSGFNLFYAGIGRHEC